MVHICLVWCAPVFTQPQNKDDQPEVLSIDAPDLVHQLTKPLRAHVIFIPTDASLCMCGIDAEEMVVNKKLVVVPLSQPAV